MVRPPDLPDPADTLPCVQISLLSRNARLFYSAMLAHTERIMPLVYTPVVGEACQQWSHLLLPPALGLYISLRDAGRVADVLRTWRSAAPVRVICVTDGERILGLGDLGANGMGIPVGKLALYSGLAGVDPRCTLPITIDAGTNNKHLLADPAYIGLRSARESGPAYDALIDEFVTAVKSVFGGDTLLQWEDFGQNSAFKFLDRYKEALPSFNDDIEVRSVAFSVCGRMRCAALGMRAALSLHAALSADDPPTPPVTIVPLHAGHRQCRAWWLDICHQECTRRSHAGGGNVSVLRSRWVAVARG